MRPVSLGNRLRNQEWWFWRFNNRIWMVVSYVFILCFSSCAFCSLWLRTQVFLSPTYPVEQTECDGRGPDWLGHVQPEVGGSCPVHFSVPHDQKQTLTPSSTPNELRRITGKLLFHMYSHRVVRWWRVLPTVQSWTMCMEGLQLPMQKILPLHATGILQGKCKYISTDWYWCVAGIVR